MVSPRDQRRQGLSSPANHNRLTADAATNLRYSKSPGANRLLDISPRKIECLNSED